MLFIFFQVGKGDDSFSDGLDIDLFDDVLEEVDGEFIGFVKVHVFVAFFHVIDIAIYGVENESADVECRGEGCNFFWEQAEQFPEGLADGGDMGYLFIYLCLRYGSISEIVIVLSCPQSKCFESQPILLLLIAFDDSIQQIFDFDIFFVFLEGGMKFDELYIAFYQGLYLSSRGLSFVDEVVQVERVGDEILGFRLGFDDDVVDLFGGCEVFEVEETAEQMIVDADFYRVAADRFETL